MSCKDRDSQGMCFGFAKILRHRPSDDPLQDSENFLLLMQHAEGIYAGGLCRRRPGSDGNKDEQTCGGRRDGPQIQRRDTEEKASRKAPSNRTQKSPWNKTCQDQR